MGWKELISSPRQTVRRRWEQRQQSLTTNVQQQKQQQQIHNTKNFEETFLKGNDDDIMNWIQYHPESCQQKIKVGRFGELSPLTIVCRKRLSLETIQAVHESYPNAMIEDPTLHHALANQSSLDVIIYLITQYPESIIGHKNGRLPFHTACANQNSLDIIQYLYNCYPEAISMTTRDGGELVQKLPLHFAISGPKIASLDVIQFLIDKYPNAVKIPDYNYGLLKTQRRGYLMHKRIAYNGNSSRTPSSHPSTPMNFHHHHWDMDCGLPLHLACIGGYASISVLRILYNAYPDAIITKNINGYLPFHLAIKSGANLSILNYLLTICPESLTEPTIENHQSPMMLASTGWNANVKIVQFLLSYRPPIEGPPPTATFAKYLDDAIELGSPPQVIQLFRSVISAGRKGYSCVRTFEV